MKVLDELKRVFAPVKILFVANLKQQTRSFIGFFIGLVTPISHMLVYIFLTFLFYQINPHAFKNLSIGEFFVALFWFRTLILFNYGLTTGSLRKLSLSVKDSMFDTVLLKPLNLAYFKYFWTFKIADFITFIASFFVYIISLFFEFPGSQFLVKSSILFVFAFVSRTFFISLMHGAVFYVRDSDFFVRVDREIKEVLTARPAEVFPRFFQFTLIFFLPYYIYYQFIFDVIRDKDTVLHWSALFIWTVILYFLNNFIWRKGIQKYESAG